MFFEITLIAYIIDRIFGEFNFIKTYKHPVVFMGEYIKWYEKKYYNDSILNGIGLTLSLLIIITFIVFILTSLIDNTLVLAFFASTGIASKMLYESVKGIIDNPNDIKYLVSRDTDSLSDSEKNKAAIETYAENLSDGVIAPLFYLFFFGLFGLFIYKGINTLDSMVGYRNERYEKFGKFSARLDDLVNFIPSRLSALIIAGLFFSKKAFREFYKYGKRHESINAGFPISAMALCIGVKLGGDTSYFGKVKKKPYFGDGKKKIEKSDILNALGLQKKLDIIVAIIFIIYLNFTFILS